MKRLFVPAVLLAMFALSTVPAQSQSSNNDDVYYSPKNDAQDNSTTTPQQPPYAAKSSNHNNPNYINNTHSSIYQDNSSDRYQNSTGSYSATDSTTGNTYVTNNYYDNQSGFYNPSFGFGYDPFYTGLGFGLYDQFYPGFSLGFGYGFGYPYYGGLYNPFYNSYYYGEGVGYYSNRGFGYYGPRKYASSGIRTVLNNRGEGGVNNVRSNVSNLRPNIIATNGVAARAVTNNRVSQVPFTRPNSVSAQSSVRRGNYYNANGRSNVPRSAINTYNNSRSSSITAQRANNINRSFFTPRGGSSGFSSYQNNNRSINSYQRSSGALNRNSSSYRSSSSLSGSSRSYSGGGSGGRSYSGGGSGSRRH